MSRVVSSREACIGAVGGRGADAGRDERIAARRSPRACCSCGVGLGDLDRAVAGGGAERCGSDAGSDGGGAAGDGRYAGGIAGTGVLSWRWRAARGSSAHASPCARFAVALAARDLRLGSATRSVHRTRALEPRARAERLALDLPILFLEVQAERAAAEHGELVDLALHLDAGALGRGAAGVARAP